MIDDIHTKSCLVFGCGNPLFGDDGFGPAVIEHLETHHIMPDHAAFMDTGTCIRDILFDILLSENKPRQIVVIDAAKKKGKNPGEIFEISVDDIDSKKTSDFSLHQFPTTNMLKELKDQTDVDVRVLVVQIQHIPDEINPGISEPVMKAIPLMSGLIIDIINNGISHKENFVEK